MARMLHCPDPRQLPPAPAAVGRSTRILPRGVFVVCRGVMHAQRYRGGKGCCHGGPSCGIFHLSMHATPRTRLSPGHS